MANTDTGPDIALPFSPFNAITSNAIDRLMALIKPVRFTFLVNGEAFESTVSEAISLSPTIHTSLQSNPLLTSFELGGNSVNSSAFVSFLEFARSRDLVSIPRARVLSFLSISGALGNERLSVALLSALNFESSTHPPALQSQSQSQAQSQLLPLPLWAQQAVQPIGLFDIANIDRCASNFYAYSIDDLRFLDHQTLHRLLGSNFLSVESEDCLLRLLLDLDLNRSEFFGCIEVSFLSMDGLKLFLEAVCFDDVCEDIWLKVVSRLKGDWDCLDELRARRYPFWFESLILRTIPRCLHEIVRNRWICIDFAREMRRAFAHCDND
jgi:hypothetical protein